MFKLLPVKESIELRQCLRRGGVFVPATSRGKTLSQCLHEVSQEIDQHVWTSADITTALSDLKSGEITSVFIKIPDNNIPALQPTPAPASAPTPVPTLIPTPVPTPDEHDQPPLVQPTAQQPIPVAPAAKLITEITRLYTEEQKYDGTSSSTCFEHKLSIFLSICQRIGLPEEHLPSAFPIMLKGLAQDHYYNNQLAKRLFEEVKNHIQNFFKGPSFHRRNLDEWNSTLLSTFIAKNTDKSTYENV